MIDVDHRLQRHGEIGAIVHDESAIRAGKDLSKHLGHGEDSLRTSLFVAQLYQAHTRIVERLNKLPQTYPASPQHAHIRDRIQPRQFHPLSTPGYDSLVPTPSIVYTGADRKEGQLTHPLGLIADLA